MKLTEKQITFLLETFFENSRYAGWRNIGKKLLETGSCIVPGNCCIWIGGIGNFIKTKNSDIAVDCLEYSFDLDYFLTSKFFKHDFNAYIDKLNSDRKEIQEKLAKINSTELEITELFSRGANVI